jgi:hypothetical protein
MLEALKFSPEKSVNFLDAINKNKNKQLKIMLRGVTSASAAVRFCGRQRGCSTAFPWSCPDIVSFKRFSSDAAGASTGQSHNAASSDASSAILVNGFKQRRPDGTMDIATPTPGAHSNASDGSTVGPITWRFEQEIRPDKQRSPADVVSCVQVEVYLGGWWCRSFFNSAAF